LATYTGYLFSSHIRLKTWYCIALPSWLKTGLLSQVDIGTVGRRDATAMHGVGVWVQQWAMKNTISHTL